MSALKHAVLHSLLRKETICCLCFNTAGSELVYLDDEAIVNESSNITLFEMLNTILGCDITQNLAFQSICTDCVVSAINSYTFIKRCKENAENLQLAIDNLDNCLQNATQNVDSCKSLYVSLDASLAAQVYYDYKRPVTSVTNALVRFKCVSMDVCNGKYYVEKPSRSQLKTWIAQNHSDSDNDYDSDFSIPKVSKLNEKSVSKKLNKLKMEFLPDHVMVHKESTHKKIICKGCEKTYETINMLRMHYMRVHAPKDLECPKCNRRFSARKLLETHLSISHANAVCFECGKTFTNIASLKKHELSHKSTKYVCQNCHRVYKTLRTIRDHVENGVCERGGRSRKLDYTGQFICDVCGDRFSSKNALHSHLITQHGFGNDETVHICSWCNKRFQAASSLKGHIVKHTRERKFQCDLCDEKFVTQPALVNHTRLHTGEKPYACDYCDESFISSSRRMEHLRRKHWEPSLPCRFCPIIFRSGAGRRKHERRHFNPSNKLYVPKDLRPEGVKEPKAIPHVDMDIEN